RRKVAVIAPRDRSGLNADLPNKFFIIAHPAYERADPAVEFSDNTRIGPVKVDHLHELEDSSDSPVLLSPDDNYNDPVGAVVPAYQGRWIAASASVGHTGFFVIVQQRFEDALKVDSL